ncbi:methyltransferase family protein [Lentiprolixibacter aurantiacus]|uniref:Isoprenylcysteine carboxylmethyltransferase family protein n=1 Tax=Lentiprolixibacter aurantiacus TaxID=2993939 RepID=A0AAE3MNP0_9FLAO|nr:isoprenylcysteine carboxylmethyltransferase family protein [Lentiprolixibacter aurantiacus]MCX2720202.1 isoprenylcysteine carboxylmethyltransferase family protein [Lentiprolixibacter aurantiacus]
MELRIPPVVVFFVFGGLMWAVAAFLPVGDFNFFGRIWLIGALLLLAMLIALIALVQFFLSQTSVDPLHPQKSRKLVTSGVYQISRNPMYLSLLLILLSLGLWLGNAFNTLTAAAFVYYMNAFQIKPEEQHLQKIFGPAYKQYCSMVRRWF